MQGEAMDVNAHLTDLMERADAQDKALAELLAQVGQLAANLRKVPIPIELAAGAQQAGQLGECLNQRASI